MLLAAVLLLCPFPQAGTAKAMSTEPAPAAVGSAGAATNTSTNASTDASLRQPSPSAPEPKVKTDVEVASAARMEPVYKSSQPNVQGVKMSIPRPTETRRQRKLWYALSITASGAATFDAWSTRRAISQGYGTEANPLLRPFSHSGAMYAATQVSPLLMDFIGKRMMASQHKWVRNAWWLPQSAGTTFSLYAGVHNTRLVP